jgi:hypothetical protein
VQGLERDLAGVADAEIAGMENDVAHHRQRNNAERVDPVEPARPCIPDAMRLELRRVFGAWLYRASARAAFLHNPGSRFSHRAFVCVCHGCRLSLQFRCDR